MKKKIILLLLGFMLLGIGGIKVFAEDEQKQYEVVQKTIKWETFTINGISYYRAYYNEKDGIQISNNVIPIVTIDGKVAFCIEMIEALIKFDDNGDGIKDRYIEDATGTRNSLQIRDFNNFITSNTSNYEKNIKYNNTNYNTQELIELIAYYGKRLYESETNNDKKNSYYLAAQRLLWQIISEAKIYPGDKYYKSNELVKGNIYIINTNSYSNSEEELKKDTSVLLDLSTYENEIMEKVKKYYNKPEILNIKEMKEYKTNENNQKYFEIENKDNLINNLEFDNSSECQFNDDKTKINCTDLDKNDKISIILSFTGSPNHYYKINEGLVESNQMILISESTPNINFEHSIELIDPEKTPIENIVTEEPPVESPPTSDTNIILIITICLCTLISAIIIYIKKVNLIKNNTI